MVYYVWEVAENLGGSKDMIGKSWGKQRHDWKILGEAKHDWKTNQRIIHGQRHISIIY